MFSKQNKWIFFKYSRNENFQLKPFLYEREFLVCLWIQLNWKMWFSDEVFTFLLWMHKKRAKRFYDQDIVLQWKCLFKKRAFKFCALFENMLIHCYLTVILRYGITRFCYFVCTCLSLNVVCFSIPVMHSKLATTCIGTIKLMIQQRVLFMLKFTRYLRQDENRKTRHKMKEKKQRRQ